MTSISEIQNAGALTSSQKTEPDSETLKSDVTMELVEEIQTAEPQEFEWFQKLDDNLATRLQRIAGNVKSRVAEPSPSMNGLDRSSWREWSSRHTTLLFTGDMVSAFIAAFACLLIRPNFYATGLKILGDHVSYLVVVLFFYTLWPITLELSGAYRIRFSSFGLRDYRIPTMAVTKLMAVAAILAFLLKAQLSRAFVFTFFPTLMVSALVVRWIVRHVLRRSQRQQNVTHRVVLAGGLSAVYQLAERLRSDPALDYHVLGICVPLDQQSKVEQDRNLTLLGVPEEIVTIANSQRADSVIIADQGMLSHMPLQRISWKLEDNGIMLFIAPAVEFTGPRISATVVAGTPLLHIAESRVDGPARRIKSAYERVIAAILLVIALPVFIAVGLLIFVGSGRPIFYRQRRVGYAGKEFSLIKFRTMVPHADKLLEELRSASASESTLFKLKNDPRVTRIGQFLRRHSLDELPQLINVVRGDMVLVGPRPCLASEANKFDEAAQRRFLARPGLTGLWQISGRSDLAWNEAVQIDLYYVENWSLLLDAMILWRTFKVVLRGTGAY